MTDRRSSGLADAAKELKAIRARGRLPFLAVVLFSIFVNLLMLTGPLFMMQVYDRVLASRHEPTLVALFAIVTFLFLVMGLLEVARSQIMARVAARFQAALDRRVFSAAMALAAKRPADIAAAAAQRDLDTIRQFIGSPLLLALLDIPWTPIFLVAIFSFHPFMGWLAIAGGGVLIAVTLLNQTLTARQRREAGETALRAGRFAEQMKTEAEIVGALGMRDAAYTRWEGARHDMLEASVVAEDRATLFRTISKVFRLFLQSAMLALGAWLVLDNLLSPGAMIASSILLGRALAPIEMAVGQWALAQQAQQGWHRLERLLAMIPAESPPTPLPRPRARLEVTNLTVSPPGEKLAVLQQVSFDLSPGQALAVIGASGSGKSSLARALTGAWPVVGGAIRLDGATLDQYEPDTLGRWCGYLPQRVVLFDGTIAENIARLNPGYDPAEVVAAAQRAGAHDMIVRLPDGYDTQVTANGGKLSGGQIQRVGLARALYGNPVMVVLDEPNSNLDNEGGQAINTAIRALKTQGAIVLIMAHRPAALAECDLLLVLEGGRRRAFGPRDEVLRETVRNSGDILRPPAIGPAQAATPPPDQRRNAPPATGPAAPPRPPAGHGSGAQPPAGPQPSTASPATPPPAPARSLPTPGDPA